MMLNVVSREGESFELGIEWTARPAVVRARVEDRHDARMPDPDHGLDLALEAAEAGVTCNAICPGYVLTPLVEKQIEDQARAHGIAREKVVADVLLKSQPNKKFAQVSEIGALTAFLCSDGAASITGAALAVDGGWTAH